MIGLVILMAGAAALMLFIGLKLSSRKVRVDRETQNVTIMRQQLEDLKAQHRAGELSDEEYHKAYDELALNLQADIRQDGTESAKTVSGLQKLQETRITLFIIILCFGILTPLLYFNYGNPDAIDLAANTQQQNPHQQGHDKNMASLDVMVGRLEQKLQANPDNAEGWFMLGRSYMVLRKYDEAVKAFEQAFKRNASDPDVLVSYADALAMQSGGGISGKSFELVRQALELAPSHKVALWLTAMGYEGQNDYKAALTYWQRLLPLMKAEPEQYKEVQARLQNAASRSGIKVETEAPPVVSTQNSKITVRVSLEQKFLQNLNGSERVFVFARAAQGPPQPLAAKRLLVSDLPATLVLDDSMAMMPTNRLSDHQRVYVGARVSRSGNPIAASGDIQGRSEILDMKKLPDVVDIVINQEVL